MDGSKMTKVDLIKYLEHACEWFFLAALATLPFAKAALEAFLLLSFVCWGVLKILKRELPTSNRWLLILIGLLIVSSSVSIYHCGYPAVAFRGLVKLLKYILVLLVAQDLFTNERRLRHLLIVGVGVFLVVALDAIYQQVFTYDLIRHFRAKETDTQIRLTGPFNQYGLLAAFIIATLPVMVNSLFIKQTRSRVTWLGLLILTGLGFYLLYRTQSRGAWIACFFSLFVLALLMRRRWLLVVLIIMVIAAPFLLPKNAFIHLDIEGKEQSVLERFALWNRAVDVIRARPLFGCGINTYVKNYPRFDRSKSWRVPGYYAHNGYLQLGAETGLISLSFFLGIVGLSFGSAWKMWRGQKNPLAFIVAGFGGGGVALLTQVGSDTTLHNLQSATLIWFYLGLLFAFAKWKESDDPKVI